jgi:trk system potassium uptake protein TrkH
MLVPVVVGLGFGERDLSSFLTTFAVAASMGSLGWLFTRGPKRPLRSRDGFLVVVFFWVIFSTISAAPFLIDRRLELHIVDAVFEGISGITTTGASVLDHIDDLPKSILYYRAQLNFLGGLGIIVLAIAVLPLLGVGGAKLYQSETPGPLKEERLTPRLADTAKHLWVTYLGLAAACGLAYFCAGMSWFDALCHSLSTMSLGGFSPHAASLGFYKNPAVEIVGGIFSILAAVNFALYVVGFGQRSIRPIVNDPEFRFFCLVLSLVVAITCWQLYRSSTFSSSGSIVHGFFQAVSIMTDNGLTAGNFPAWPEYIALLMIGSSYFGGCVGSTCGGIKAMRLLVLYRQSQREVNQLIHPKAVFVNKIGSRSVSDRVVRSVWGLFFLWATAAVAFTWGLTAAGYDLATAFGTVAACLNNMGVGYGITASGFGTLNDSAKWLMCTAMLFGRLEIFPILIVASRTFWRF